MKKEIIVKKSLFRINYIALLGCVALVLSACGTSSFKDAPLPQLDESFSPVPLQSSIDQVQPMTGIVVWTSNGSALADLGETVQLEYSYIIYGDVVSEKGVYNWDVIDSLLDEVAGRGHQAILRFRYTYPGETDPSVPAYIENSPGYNSVVGSVQSQSTYLPDWSFSGLQEFTLDFYTAFAERYDNDPRIAFLQVGFGSYAEYHLYDGNVKLGRNFPSMTFQTIFLKHLASQFNNLHWSMSIDAASSEYTPIAANPGLLALEFGLFDDSLMHKTHSKGKDEYNRQGWLAFGSDRYQTSPAGGEFSYYSEYDQRNVLNEKKGAHGRSFESFAEQYHLSYIIGNDQPKYQTPARIKEAAMATGYKFDVTYFMASETESVVRIRNTGIAPLYYDAYPAVNGVRATESLKGLLPNRSMDFMIPSGGAEPLLTIESDHLVPGQVIQFDANL